MLILLGISLPLADDYGASIDEPVNAAAGESFLRLYGTQSLFQSPDIDYFHGPFYFMLFSLTSGLLRDVHPAWLLSDGRHMTNFLAFLLSVYFLYRLSLRVMPFKAALFASALFATQPLLFGHAFINQKDVPFMALFVASVELGLTAVDRWALQLGRPPIEASPFRLLAADWRRKPGGSRLAWILGFAGFGILTIDVAGHGLLRSIAMDAVRIAYNGQGPALGQVIFQRFAEQAPRTPLADYLAKLDLVLFWTRLAISPLWIVMFFAMLRNAFPELYADVVSPRLHAWGPLVGSAIALGLTTSTRIAGPFAAILVGIYGFWRVGRAWIRPWLVYAVAGFLVTYATWPTLWGDPLQVLLDRLSTSASFTDNDAFFLGRTFDSDNIPASYIPLLLAIQLTVPAVALVPIGLVGFCARALKNKPARGMAALAGVWVAAPVAAVVSGIVPVYNNSRHLLFIMPCLFLLAGYGGWLLSGVFRRPLVIAAVSLLSLAPGVAGIWRLHPYEYIYYNEFAGGVRGAAGRFDLDYWCTASRQAMGFVNQVAPAGATLAGRFIGTAQPFAREDLVTYAFHEDSPLPDVLLECGLPVFDQPPPPPLARVYELRVEGVPIAAVSVRRP